MIQSIQHAGARFASRYQSGAVKDCTAALAMILGFAALAFVPMFFLLWLMQPKVLANPGTTARAVPRIVYAEPPPADLGVLQSAEAPERDVMPFRQSEAQLPQPRSAKYQSHAHKRITRVRTSKAHAARTPDAGRIATRQTYPREGLRNARAEQRVAEMDASYRGNRIVPADSIDGTCAFPPDGRCDNRPVDGSALSKPARKRATLSPRGRDFKAEDFSNITANQVGFFHPIPHARL